MPRIALATGEIASNQMITIRDASKLRRVYIVQEIDGKKGHEEFQYLTFPKNNFDPNKFTLVYIPGGPGGGTSYAAADYFALNEMPSGIQFLFLDPRGTGINFEIGEKDQKALSTKKNVDDIIEVLKHSRLSNYAVWGSSYGTIVATQLVHQLETAGFSRLPKAAILEGTFGKAYHFSEKFYEGLDQRIRDFYTHLPPSAEESLKRLRKATNTERVYQAHLVDLFKATIYKSPAARAQAFSDEVDKIVSGVEYIAESGPFSSYAEMPLNMKARYINEYIICNELVEVKTPADEKRYFEMNYYGPVPGPCVPKAGKQNLYDSVNFQIKATPIVYLQGFNDFQTPLPSALHHYFSQKNIAEKSSFSLIFGANHGIFTEKFASCLVPFAKDLRDDDLSLSSMRACAVAKKMEIKGYEH